MIKYHKKRSFCVTNQQRPQEDIERLATLMKVLKASLKETFHSNRDLTRAGSTNATLWKSQPNEQSSLLFFKVGGSSFWVLACGQNKRLIWWKKLCHVTVGINAINSVLIVFSRSIFRALAHCHNLSGDLNRTMVKIISNTFMLFRQWQDLWTYDSVI